MNRLKWPKFFFFKNIAHRVKGLSKPFLIIAIIILFLTNGVFWAHRLSKGGFTTSKRPEVTEKEPKKLDENNDNKLPQVKEAKEVIKKEEHNLVISKNDEKNLKGLQKPQSENKTLGKAKEVAATIYNDELESKPVLATMAAPVLGRTIVGFAVDSLVYSKTLEQWSAHHGIDIEAEEGTPVKAVMEGKVIDIREKDPYLGVVIMIDHGDDVITVYGNLSKTISVKKNDIVKKGQIIGSVGKTAPYEIEDPPHLHFEILKDGKNLDPHQFLPKLN